MLTFAALTIGFALTSRYEAQTAADAVAMAGGFTVMSNPGPTYSTKWASASTVTIASTNQYGTFQPENPTFAMGTDKVIVSTSMSGSQAGAGNHMQALSFHASSQALVHQIESATVTPIRPPVALALDFSSSMLSRFNNAGASIIKTLRTATSTMLAQSNAQDVDWGHAMFQDSIIQPSMSIDANLTLAQRQQRLTQMSSNMSGTAPQGQNTNYAAVISGVTSWFNGKAGSIVLVSDGVIGGTEDDKLAAEAAAAQAKQLGLKIYTLRVPSTVSHPVVDPSVFMQQLATSTGGDYAEIAGGQQLIDVMTGLVDNLDVTCNVPQALQDYTNGKTTPPPATERIYVYTVVGTLETALKRVATEPQVNSDTLGTNFWYDASTGKIVLNGAVCAPFLAGQALKVRVRWGIPELIDLNN